LHTIIDLDSPTAMNVTRRKAAKAVAADVEGRGCARIEYNSDYSNSGPTLNIYIHRYNYRVRVP